MEDEGTVSDHLSGVSATDGQWHHVAVRGRRGALASHDDYLMERKHPF